MIEPGNLRLVSATSATGGLELRLLVDDREMVADLEAFPEGRERTTFALNALRIGLLALKQARGRIDADAVKLEGERILASLGGALKAHEELLTRQVKETLGSYFDPRSGKFSERVERLLQKDGEIETALRRQISGDGSELAKTLAANVGRDSPIGRMLNPTQSDGVVSLLGRSVHDELVRQRDAILAQFSLNAPDSALSRLVHEVKSKSGELGTDLKTQIDRAVKELSLDQDGSSLGRLRGELLKVIADQTSANTKFQEDVRVTLERMSARKAEAAKSTRHGTVFEDDLCAFLEKRALAAGDTPQRTGQISGLITRNYVGDLVVTLGGGKTASGARIVVEAKENADTTLALARGEIETARTNRGAQVGVFVLSRLVAPPGYPTFHRDGDDVFVLWDSTDPASDTNLEAAMSVAEALCTRAALHSAERTQDLAALDKSVNEVEKAIGTLVEISDSAETIAKGAARVTYRVNVLRTTLTRQVEILRDGLTGLRTE